MEEEILKGYDKGLETAIPWKIPHYGEHFTSQHGGTNIGVSTNTSDDNMLILNNSNNNNNNNNNNTASNTADNSNSGSNSTIEGTPTTITSSSTASYQDIKFVNYILENNHYRFNNNNNSNNIGNNINHSKIHIKNNEKIGVMNTYLENDAMLEFNSMLKENQSIHTHGSTGHHNSASLKNQSNNKKNNSPVSLTTGNGYKYIRPRSRTSSVPMLTHINKIVKPEDISPSSGTVNGARNCNTSNNTNMQPHQTRYHPRHHSSTTYYNYNTNNIVKYDMGSMVPIISDNNNNTKSIIRSNSNNNGMIQQNRNQTSKSTPIKYNPNKYLDYYDGKNNKNDNNKPLLFDEDVEYIPKDMEIDLERLLSCDTVDRVLSSRNGAFDNGNDTIPFSPSLSYSTNRTVTSNRQYNVGTSGQNSNTVSPTTVNINNNNSNDRDPNNNNNYNNSGEEPIQYQDGLLPLPPVPLTNILMNTNIDNTEEEEDGDNDNDRNVNTDKQVPEINFLDLLGDTQYI